MSDAAATRVPTVLVIDFNPTGPPALANHLEQSGCGVISARDGTAGLELARRAQPDLIVVDILMPGMDGCEVCRRLKACDTTREIPIIVRTPSTETSTRTAAFEAGAADCITGPFQAEEVLARVRTHLELARLRTQLAKQAAQCKRAEEALTKSQERFAAVFDACPAAIAISVLEDGRFLVASRAFAELLGYTRDEIIGHTALERGIWADPQDRERIVESLKAGHPVRNQEALVRTKDGRTLSGIFTFALAELDGRPCLLTIESDVAGRKRVERELQAWMHRYELIVEASGQVAYEYVVPTGHIAWGSSIETVLGYTEGELRGDLAEWEALLHPEDREKTLAVFDAARKACTYWDAQYRMRHKSGGYVWIRDRGFFLPDAEGNAVSQLGMLEDITGKKKAEEELSYRNTLLSTQQEASPAGILVVDQSGRIVSFNRRFVELWGIPDEVMASQRDELALQAVMDKIADPERFRSQVAGIYADPQRTTRDEIVLTDGRTIDRYSAPVSGSDGTYYGRVWYFSDITERKRAEEALKKSEQRFATVFRANPAAISLVRMSDGRIIDVNDAHVRLFGHSREETIGQSPGDLGYWTDAADIDRMRRVREAQGYVDNWEAQFRAKDGRTITALMTIELVELGGEMCRVCLFSDITARKREEAERARLEAQLQQAQRLESVGRLAGGVAHDFNNLLTVINGYSEILLKGLTREDPRHSQVEQIRQAGDRAAGLTQQLLAFSRKQMIQPQPLNLNDVVGNTEKMLRRLIGEDIELRTVLDPSLGTVMADPGQIDQILINLAVNARDAMPTGGQLSIETANVDVDSRYEAGHAEVTPGPSVLLVVSDTGTGMDAETQRHLFEPFFTTKERGRGTGLGLATVYGIVKQSGGWISVYSEPDKGTAFKVYFPRTAATGEAVKRREVETSGLRGQETVLIVEDQEEVRTFAVAALQEYGYRFLEAPDGDKALELLRHHDAPVGVMVTDVVLPGMNGRQLAERAAGLCPRMKIIYTSGYTEDAIVNRGVLAEGVDFLPKPYTATELVARIRKALG